MNVNITPPEESRNKIKGLVEKFSNDFYNVKNWSEEDTKVQYISPFFEALGWDVSNREGNVGSSIEVSFETKVNVKGSSKSADYSFYLGKLLFHVEAKKPLVNIKDKMDSSFQIRSYVWSSSCILGVLTDFEELSIYQHAARAKQNRPS